MGNKDDQEGNFFQILRLLSNYQTLKDELRVMRTGEDLALSIAL